MPRDVPATELDRRQLGHDWGVTWPEWPDWPWDDWDSGPSWSPSGRITAGHGPDEFGLGYVIDTLKILIRVVGHVLCHVQRS